MDGLIVYPAEGDENATIFKEIQASGFPLVLIDRAPRGCEEMVVLTDNIAASREATKLLLDQGCNHVAFFGTNSDKAMSIRERHLGFEAAVGTIDQRYERWIHMNLDENADSMYQAVSDALIAMRARDPQLNGAFCTQDWLARALILACQNEGIEVGSQFHIATYNDFGETFFRHPRRLIRIEQQVEEISRRAVERLYELQAGTEVLPGPIRVEARLFLALE